MVDLDSATEVNAVPVPTTTTGSSKVYVRFYSYTAFFDIDKVLPSVLDPTENGGLRTPITNEEWLAFCERLDNCFQRVNTMQSVNFYIDILILITVILYLALVYIMFIFPMRSRFLVFVACVAAANSLFHFYIRGPAATTGINNAKRICEEETNRLNLRAGHGNSISIVFHYTKRKCCNCEGYEFDREGRQRYHDIYVEVTVQGTDIEYGGGTAATLVATAIPATSGSSSAREFFAATRAPGSFRPSPPFANERADARKEPYVTDPPPPMAKAKIVSDEEQP